MSKFAEALQLISFLILCTTIFGVRSLELGPTVYSENLGVIRGVKANDGDYNMYLGIPYATVNKSNPFGPSIPNTIFFKDGFDAFNNTAMCPQIDEFTHQINGSLDCLHINIYVHNSVNTDNPLPVLIWIYGGGHKVGFAGRFGPKFMMKHEIILVLFDFRLGPYGNMCLGIPEAQCNEGMKDQMKALKWIHDNISDFGGDLSKVTLYGGSSGGNDAEILLTKEENSFIDKVIVSSGGASVPWVFIEPNEETPFILAKYYGFNTSDVKEALYFLANVEPKSLIKAVNETNIIFGPCLEKESEEFDSFVTEYPIHLKPKANLSAALLGYNNDEILFISYIKEALHPDYLNLVKYFQFDDASYEEIKKLIRNLYDDDAEDNSKRNMFCKRFREDLSYYYPIEISTRKYIDHGVGNIYRYMFSYNGSMNFNKSKFNITGGGAAHVDEMSYVFDIAIASRHMKKDDELIVERMTTLWANFVKYGDPTPETTELLPVKWPPISSGYLPCININRNMSLIHRPFQREMAFYDLLFERYKENMLRTGSNYR